MCVHKRLFNDLYVSTVLLKLWRFLIKGHLNSLNICADGVRQSALGIILKHSLSIFGFVVVSHVFDT